MGEDTLVPLAGMLMVVAIVGISHASRTIRHYLDWRMRMAERQLTGTDKSLSQVLRELQAEIAALKQHEAEAVLSFDSTLQRLEQRVGNLERRELAAGTGERTALPSDARFALEEPVRAEASPGAARLAGAP